MLFPRVVVCSLQGTVLPESPRQPLTCQPHLCRTSQVEVFEAGGVNIVNLGWVGIWCHSTAFLGEGCRGQVMGNLGLPNSEAATPAVPLEASGIAFLSRTVTDFHDLAQGGLLREKGPVTLVSLTNTAPLRRSGTVMGVKPCREGRGISPRRKDSGCPAIPQSTPQQRTLLRPESWVPVIGVLLLQAPCFPRSSPTEGSWGRHERSSVLTCPFPAQSLPSAIRKCVW